MKLWELRNILDEYDGEMEVIVLDYERNAYDFEGITIDHRDEEPTLALKFE